MEQKVRDVMPAGQGLRVEVRAGAPFGRLLGYASTYVPAHAAAPALA